MIASIMSFSADILAAENADKEPLKEPWSILMESLKEILTAAIENLPNIVAAVIVLLLTSLSVFLFRKIAPKFYGKFGWRTSLEELFLTLGKAIIWIFGLIIAAMIVFPGLTPSKALGAAGLASVAVGLAFKDIFQNFFAGILLMWRFPFEPDDVIECGDVKGRVLETQLRLTTIRSPSGELIIVPNSYLVENPIDVYTEADFRRVEITTGVAYSENVADALKVLKDRLEECDTVNKEKPRDILVSNFGASSIDINVLYWTKSQPMDVRKSKSEVIIALKEALDAAGIEIPFPYRTMTFAEPLLIENKTSQES